MKTSNTGKKKLPWTGILVLLVGIMLLVPIITTSFFTVQEGQTALVYRYGKLKEILGSGTHSKAPFGIDKTAIIPTGSKQLVTVPVELEQSGLLPFITKDDLPVYAQFNVIYSITDPLAYYRFAGNRDYMIYAVVQDILVRFFNKETVSTFSGDDGSAGIAARVLNLLSNEDTFNSWGIKIEKTELLQFDTPLSDPAQVVADDTIISITIDTLMERLKERYKQAYVNNELSESAKERIKEEGYPWE